MALVLDAEEPAPFPLDVNRRGRGAEVLLRREDRSIAVLSSGGVESFAAPPSTTVVDTTGAGDSFNAAYLAGRVRGDSIAGSIAAARRLPEAVGGCRGAIIPKSAMPG